MAAVLVRAGRDLERPAGRTTEAGCRMHVAVAQCLHAGEEFRNLGLQPSAFRPSLGVTSVSGYRHGRASEANPVLQVCVCLK